MLISAHTHRRAMGHHRHPTGLRGDARTLDRWRREHRRHREEIVAMYDEAFYRTRDLWLAASQAGFRYGDLGLSQFVISKGKPREWPLTRAHLYRDAPADGLTRAG